MLAIVCDCAHVIGHYGVGNISPLQHSVALLVVERNIITKQWKGLSPPLLFPTSNHRVCFSHALLLWRDPFRTARCTNAWRCRCCKGDEGCAHTTRAAVEPLHGQVTHLPQWRGEPTAAAVATSRPSSYVRPSALRARKVFTTMERPPRARPRCCSPPPPHDLSLRSGSICHGDIRALLRPKKKGVNINISAGSGELCAGRAVHGCPWWTQLGDATLWRCGGGGENGEEAGGEVAYLRGSTTMPVSSLREVTSHHLWFSTVRAACSGKSAFISTFSNWHNSHPSSSPVAALRISWTVCLH